MARCVLGSLMLTVLLTSCEDPFIDPFVTGKHFTVYGFISPFTSEHAVRVIAVRRYPEEILTAGAPHSEIDAEVFSTNLSTGQTTRWTHNLVRLDDDTFGHVFSARFVVYRGLTYRLTVRRSDGAESVAETTVPERMEAITSPAVINGDTVTQAVRWKDVPKVDRIDIVYCAARLGLNACDDGADGGGYLINYGKAGRRVGNDWEVTVQLSRDFVAMRTAAGLSPNTPLQLNSLQMRVYGLDDKWVTFDDPELLAQPNVLNNVENGFGYWGSIGNGLLDWVPEADALARMGVTVPN